MNIHHPIGLVGPLVPGKRQIENPQGITRYHRIQGRRGGIVRSVHGSDPPKGHVLWCARGVVLDQNAIGPQHDAEIVKK